MCSVDVTRKNVCESSYVTGVRACEQPISDSLNKANDTSGGLKY